MHLVTDSPVSVPGTSTRCPTLGHWVVRRDEECRGGRTITLLVHHDGGALQLSSAELAAVGPLDGSRSWDEIVRDPASVDLLDALDQGGFLSDSVQPARRSLGVRRMLASMEVEWRGADRFVQWAYRRGLHCCFRRSSFVAQVGLAIAGLAALVAAIGSPRRVEIEADAAHVPQILLLGLVAVAIHELAHALVVVRNGRRVSSIGFRLHLGTPSFFVDAVEALLLPRRQRLVQAAAGPWAEWLVTSVVALVLWIAPSGDTTTILHRFVLLNAMTIASNLLPFVGLDGSWLLADGLREPDLARRSQGAVGRLWLGVMSHRAQRSADVAMAVYAILNAVVAALLAVTSIYFWWALFGDLVSDLAAGGVGGRMVLIVVGILIGRPIVASIGPRAIDAATTVGRLAGRVVFRFQQGWRVRATEQLATLPALAGFDDRALSIIAGRLRGRRALGGSVPVEPGYQGYAVRLGRDWISPVVVDGDRMRRLSCSWGARVVFVHTDELAAAAAPA